MTKKEPSQSPEAIKKARQRQGYRRRLIEVHDATSLIAEGWLIGKNLDDPARKWFATIAKMMPMTNHRHDVSDAQGHALKREPRRRGSSGLINPRKLRLRAQRRSHDSFVACDTGLRGAQLASFGGELTRGVRLPQLPTSDANSVSPA